MNNHLLASSSSLFVLASILFASSGCATQVVGGVEAGSDAGSTAAVTSVAILGAHMPEDKLGYLTQLAQITVQPDSLYVFIGNFDEQCQSPFPAGCETNTPSDAPYAWQVVLGIPASLQKPGVLTIPQAGVDASFSTSGVGGSGSGPIPNVGVGCVGSNDSLMGEIAITSIDATQVTLDFMGVQTLLEEPVAPPVITAQYETTRCP